MTDHLRVSDAERREASELLSRHFVDGRLDQEELDERIGGVMRSRTRGDLGRLFADLPPLAAVTAPALRPHRGARLLVAVAVVLALLVPASLLARGQAVQAHRPMQARLLPFVRVAPRVAGPAARAGMPVLPRPSTSR